MDEQKNGLIEYQKLTQQSKQLQKYFDEFNQLKFIVNEQFADRFPDGLSALDHEASADLKKITELFKKLETQLQQLARQIHSAEHQPKTQR
ncbi:hypothetical protein AAEY27_22275 [Kosakonia sp. BYX6]|uniref:Type III secretion system chaperone SseA n=1 Tax=Kosakonia calanthes TaxID=3139408 RepID=A0ABZ3B4N0_9ENTR